MYMCMCMCVCMGVCTYIYIYIYICATYIVRRIRCVLYTMRMYVYVTT